MTRSCGIHNRSAREEHPLGRPNYVRLWCRREREGVSRVSPLEFCGWQIGYAERGDARVHVFFTTGETYVVAADLGFGAAVRPGGPGDLWATCGIEHRTLESAEAWLADLTASHGSPDFHAAAQEATMACRSRLSAV